VAGKLCKRVEDYTWSSWREYSNTAYRMTALCSVNCVLIRIPLKELEEQVNTPLPKTQQVLEYDRYRGFVPNEAVTDFLKSTYHICHPKDLKLLPKDRRNEILAAATEIGAGMRQLSRLTSFSPYIISQARKNKKPPL
jgi:hypothetical protein